METDILKETMTALNQKFLMFCVEKLKQDHSSILAPAVCDYLLQTMNIINQIQISSTVPQYKNLLHSMRKLVTSVNAKYYEVKSNQRYHGTPKTSVIPATPPALVNKFAEPPPPLVTPVILPFELIKPMTKYPPDNPSAQPPPVASQDEDDNDEPPKVEFERVVEEDALYSKRCKLYEKRDGNFKERGIGVLYINKLKTDKYQVVIRADNSLGTVLLNMLLNSKLPVQKSGKNNVLTVDTTADGGKGNSILIRVKTGEDVDELIAKLNELKGNCAI